MIAIMLNLSNVPQFRILNASLIELQENFITKWIWLWHISMKKFTLPNFNISLIINEKLLLP